MVATDQTTGLNSTAASLLGFLHAGALSGYELVGVAQEIIGDFWSLTRSQVYRELATLARRGLVEAGEAGPRSRRRYHLTEAGRAAFAEWIAQPPGAEQIRYPLLLTLSFGAWLGPRRLLDIVAEHRHIHTERLARYLHLQAQLGQPGQQGDTEDTGDGGERDPYQQATLAFGVHYERAVLAWMDELPRILAAAHHE